MHRTPEQIEIEAIEMAMANLDEAAAALGFEPNEDGLWSAEAGEAVLTYFRDWLTGTDRRFNDAPPPNSD